MLRHGYSLNKPLHMSVVNGKKAIRNHLLYQSCQSHSHSLEFGFVSGRIASSMTAPPELAIKNCTGQTLPHYHIGVQGDLNGMQRTPASRI